MCTLYTYAAIADLLSIAVLSYVLFACNIAFLLYFLLQNTEVFLMEGYALLNSIRHVLTN